MALVVAFLIPASLQAQRGGANAAAGFHSGFGGQRGLSGRPLSRRGSFSGGFHRRNNYGAYFLPYDDGFEYDQPAVDEDANTPMPRAAILRQQEPPVPKGQVIEIPRGENAAVAKVLPPTIFILANGERLEAKRFVLTASLLSISIDRHQRVVPVDKLDINATIAANQERGIDLRIPDDRNEISLSF